ncbi:anti-sigma factor [Flavobacterium arcticum]|uniref:Anti-sigma factor n=1 Tax=Flavobacterium arcticum TaxID=1784713 RepID=A0A345HE16_9FLAO|nr:anti-sigma factor [Flavobacterium arcticum]AXG74826.1 anti-sigma factor [Flavobacterium arcticum]KAF2509676.1 anti-sigma factor [Flavobacterium arcticum]
MKNEKDNLEQLFSQLKNDWDTEKPADGHELRFMQRLENKPKKKKTIAWTKIIVPIAASIAILLGVFVTYQPEEPKTAELSPEVKETQLYFASIIKSEMTKIERESTPETKKIVQDAMVQMDLLESDYNKLILELKEKGENKKIIHAMITNLQTRISFLERVLTQIENTQKIKNRHYENNNA